MSDPYREATRHERTGMSTFARIFLVGGGLLATLVVAGAIWAVVAARGAMDEWERYWQEARIEYVQDLEVAQAEAAEAAAALAELRAEVTRRQSEAARRTGETRSAVRQVDASLAELREAVSAAQRAMEAAAHNAAAAAHDAEPAARAANVPEVQRSLAEPQEPLAAELSSAVVTVLRSTFDDPGYELSPAESGFGIEVTPREGAVKRVGLEFVSVGELLERVGQGESVLSGVDRSGEARSDPQDDAVFPDWVPVYPGSHSGDRYSATLEDISVGGAVFVADAGGHRILDWYDRTARRMSREGTDFDIRIIRSEEDRLQDLRSDLGRYAMSWDDRVVSVFVIEDDHGDSLFVLLYKETAGDEG